MALRANRPSRLAPDVNRILFVRNLPWKITAEELYDVFGRYGAIRQIRVGNANDTRGTAYVVYEDIFDAKQACENLSGFNVGGRYLVVLYYQPTKTGKADVGQLRSDIASLSDKVAANERALKAAQGMDGDEQIEDDDRRLRR